MRPAHTAKLNQFHFAELYSRFRHRHRFWHLTPFLVHYGDHCHFVNTRVRQQNSFNIQRRNVFSTAHFARSKSARREG
jgi:hypothetical protein